MMMKTHLAIACAVALGLLPFVTYKFIFFPVVLFSTLLPDIDIAHSYLGKRWYFRPIQLFVKHRGLIHSFTICILISFVLAFYFPIFALPFFVGYMLHLFGDSLTIEGIRPFWPHKKEVAGKIRTQGHIESGIFLIAIVASIIFLVGLFI